MNGRVYDPVLGRFISADPQVQFASNLQSYNRYSYVHNNPLSFTDPSGYGLFEKIKKAFKKGARVLSLQYAISEWVAHQSKKNALFQAVVRVGMLAGCYSNPGTAALCAAATSAGFTLLNGGSVGDAIREGMIAGATALAFNGVGNMTQPGGSLGGSGVFGKAIAHGIVGGTSSKLSGGSFRSGFLAAGATAGINGSLGTKGDPTLALMRSAIAGGVGSELGGGKFANGATTGSFSYLFNDLAHEGTAPRPIDWRGIGGRILGGIRSVVNPILSALTITGSTPQYTLYRHYGYAADAALFEGGLRPGSYATTADGVPMTGAVAQDRLALPHAAPPDAYYNVHAPVGTPVIGPTIVQPTITPPRSGGGIEFIFPEGTPPGTVFGPVPIPLQ
jgi:hypothetical protein